MNKTSNTPKIIKTVLLTLIGIFMILPLVWMISASFKFESDVFTMPIKKWNPKILQHLKDLIKFS